MTDDSSRTEKYELIRKRFLSDPEFRDQLTKNPAETLESILGPLTDQERNWLSSAPEGADELLDYVKQNPPPVGYW
ncbi:hypothetical protein [Nakamurella multipartita]|jgi:hypothetical protein|uniref:Uncharacterized protein n=1 Tax=Nakamurella multipartita (strain ATCC 700099 / DSM 44233 / CIP 104796 / JCM 9543 / NBRC 105858 / Y-104) TaxID=479431 RepID=C8XB83_NAKMY|nr:hypothetical protein [Nakamurella multipartita]ACV81375.1 hypothetical protein Namu_5105 [Nakamurella multipartita DSM 44233]